MNEPILASHTHFSAACFNECWGYIDQAERTQDDNVSMLATAYASYYHWTKRDDVQPMNLSISYWQLGRVHCLLKEFSLATTFGQQAVDISQREQLGPFSLGYGYEVLARAAIGLGQFAAAKEALGLAEAELGRIADAQNHELLATDLKQLRDQLST